MLRSNGWLFLWVTFLFSHSGVALESSSQGNFAGESTFVGYNSDVTHSPGSFIFPVFTQVSNLPKFDSSLGALTGLSISVPDTNPIYYDIVASFTAVGADSDFSGSFAPIDVVAGIFYETPGGSIVSVLTDNTTLGGAGCSGGEFESSCGFDPIYANDSLLDGVAEFLGDVDPADFTGSGNVDALFFGIGLDSTAEFTLDNATASLAVYIDTFNRDTFDGESSLTLTYEFTPVPLPPTVILFASGLVMIMRRIYAKVF